jgi:hypothetical protein
MAKLRRHRKQKHPKAHKKSVKKALKTKGYPTSMGELSKIAKKPSKRKRMGKWKLDPLKVRKGLIKNPKVLGFSDYKCAGLVRVLRRVGDNFPEFALYPSRKTIIIPSLQQAGFKQESRGKWVLRTNKFNIFVYV